MTKKKLNKKLKLRESVINESVDYSIDFSLFGLEKQFNKLWKNLESDVEKFLSKLQDEICNRRNEICAELFKSLIDEIDLYIDIDNLDKAKLIIIGGRTGMEELLSLDMGVYLSDKLDFLKTPKEVKKIKEMVTKYSWYELDVLLNENLEPFKRKEKHLESEIESLRLLESDMTAYIDRARRRAAVAEAKLVELGVDVSKLLEGVE